MNRAQTGKNTCATPKGRGGSGELLPKGEGGGPGFNSREPIGQKA